MNVFLSSYLLIETYSANDWVLYMNVVVLPNIKHKDVYYISMVGYR